MGTKFANIQVREKDINIVEGVLKEYIKKHDKKLPANFLSFIFNSMNYYVGNALDGWITILHDTFEWGNIEQIALDFSECYTGAILAIGYFDDDVFGMSLIKQGYTLSTHVSGESAEFYGAEEQLGDIDLFIKELNLSIEPSSLISAMENDDLEEQIQELERLFEVAIWIKSEWLSDMDNETQSKFRVVK